ncbi:MAG TPA: DUF11 domain-containing protein [Candidatus Absconditabacterales bacterium]|nr:DUF11 domain-containing protein [Candidatus Absconditabacterales bacterium]
MSWKRCKALDAFSGFVYINTGIVSGGNTHSVALSFVPNSADLVIQKTGSVDYASSGELVSYAITVTNNGPEALNNLTINDILGTGLVYIASSLSPSVVAQPVAGGLLYGFEVPGLFISGANLTLYLTAMVVDSSGSFVNTVSVTGDLIDMNETNNNSSRTIFPYIIDFLLNGFS